MPVTNYVWDGDQYLVETDETDTTQAVFTNEPDEYTNLISQHRDNATQFAHFDALGSTRELTDASETVTDDWSYDAWGNIFSRTGTTEFPFQFVGRFGYYYDSETDSFYVVHRIYEPETGRWTSFDPFYTDSGLNLFMYATNRPADNVDPSGNECVAVQMISVTRDKSTVRASRDVKITERYYALGYAGLIRVRSIYCSRSVVIKRKYWCECSYCHFGFRDNVPEWFEPAIPFHINSYKFNIIRTSMITETWEVKVNKETSDKLAVRVKDGWLRAPHPDWNYRWASITDEGTLYGGAEKIATEVCKNNLPKDKQYVLGANLECPIENVAKKYTI